MPENSPPKRSFTLATLVALVAFLSSLLLTALAPTGVRAQDAPPTATPEAVIQPTATFVLGILPTPTFGPTPDPAATATLDPLQVPTVDPALLPTPDPNAAVPLPTLDPSSIPPTAEIVVEATPEPTDTPAPPPVSDDPLVHIVQVGESLSSLAAQSGFSVSDLAERNALTNPNMLLSGQRVRMPEQPSNNIQLHRVSPGETLMSIAAQYGVSPYLLRQTNRLPCGTCLVFGQLLRVPAQQAGTASNLPEPFGRVDVSPIIPKQGDVIIVRVQARAPLQQISGTLADRPLRFAKEGDEYVALSGMGALQEPGIYPITIRAITENGAASVVNGRVQMNAGRFAFENLAVGPKLVPLLEPQVNVDERNELDTIFSQFSGTQYWEGALEMPIKGRIVSYYGTRRNFNRGTLRTFHSGIDLSAPTGTPIKASAPGRIAAVQPFKIRGNVVIIDHGRGVFTIYCHMSKFNVQVGQIVNVGDVIGYAGNTGRSLGPHLHWEMAVGGVTVDPLQGLNVELP